MCHKIRNLERISHFNCLLLKFGEIIAVAELFVGCKVNSTLAEIPVPFA